MYYAHSGLNSDKSDWQTLKDHLINVSEIAGGFADIFSAREIAEMAGLLHDIGKYSIEFQTRLEGMNIRVNHSSAGAKEAVEMFGKLWGISLAYAISGHHGGIPNGGCISPSDLQSRLQAEIKDYSAYELEIRELLKKTLNNRTLEIDKRLVQFQMANFTRMIYSCLVDADFLDTERVLDKERSDFRLSSKNVMKLLPKFQKHMKGLSEKAADSEINIYREYINECCSKRGKMEQGVFSLTVPTGGGKTLASMAFALHHAKKHRLSRIIYVIPYTSIIEQNASVFRKIFGEENVLEHHSSYQFEDYADADEEMTNGFHNSLRLATENWECPIIVTTNVQFFESLFSNKPSKCRKLHNITNSVIILDEAQMLPYEYLKPAVSMLSDLTLNYNSSVVLCTATQPVLDPFFSKNLKVSEIVGNQERMAKAFKRVKVEYSGNLSDEMLKERILKQKQVLCIVNTRRHAAKLYESIKGKAIHLSARMCPKHRRHVLKKINKLLDENRQCRVVSTQLIEAGVDIDFPVVYRAMAGLDSIAQASGRCNREASIEKGSVFVFEPEKIGMPGGWLSGTAASGREAIRNLESKDDILDAKSIKKYFELLYWKDEKLLDKKEILKRTNHISKEFIYPFKDIAEDFKLIENDMFSIIVPYESDLDEYKLLEFESTLKKMKFSQYKKGVIKELQPYTVQVYRHEFKKLNEAGALEQPADGVYLLARSDLYNLDTGLQIPNIEYGLGQELVF
ncbi:MAG TPA: CRISPR-associated helicase Cas3' [Clostridia bacterium]|nr:CRISPR-associated helicase Cas3' [Clostridia bacterium]